ncbi:MAG: hypothetical protein JNJ54_23580 [Myxococcaceae bacterium]|nr:hypothetical protein [Myxococcaceae bacterium]
MTRTVALGALIGFAITIVALALWERGAPAASSSTAAATDAGAPVFLNPTLQRGLLTAPVERRVERVILAPLPMADADAGAP